MVSESNESFRRARERTSSAADPGECLSRQELADLVNDHVWTHHDQVVAVDANYIGKLERGVIGWPGERYRAAFRAVLRAPNDAALGFRNRRSTVTRIVDVDRRKFLLTAAAGSAALTPLAATLESGPATVPSRVGATEIGQIRAAARVFADWDRVYGGGLAREAVVAQLRWSASLLDASCPEEQRNHLCSAVAELAETAGFMAFDAGRHDEAERSLRFALACAEEGADWHLRAAILTDLARQAVWLARPDLALTYSEQALVRADRLTATERAMAHTSRARALAAMHRVPDTRAAIGIADECFAHSRPGDDSPWMAFYDTAEHVGDTGHALADLAPTGHGAVDAARRLTEAIDGHGPAFARPRVLSQLKLATLHVRTGDAERAAAVGHSAVDGAATMRSRRTVEGLRALDTGAGQHGAIPALAHLREHIATALRAE